MGTGIKMTMKARGMYLSELKQGTLFTSTADKLDRIYMKTSNQHRVDGATTFTCVELMTGRTENLYATHVVSPVFGKIEIDIYPEEAKE